jgi:Amt family ammonium transporter
MCYYTIQLKNKFSYDDTLDAFGVHGISGIWGTLATGLFATTTINPAGANGLFYGNPKLLGIQGLGVLAIAVFAFVATWIIIKILDAVMGIRIEDHAETIGLDLTQHGEAGYHM